MPDRQMCNEFSGAIPLLRWSYSAEHLFYLVRAFQCNNHVVPVRYTVFYPRKRRLHLGPYMVIKSLFIDRTIFGSSPHSFHN